MRLINKYEVGSHCFKAAWNVPSKRKKVAAGEEGEN